MRQRDLRISQVETQDDSNMFSDQITSITQNDDFYSNTNDTRPSTSSSNFRSTNRAVHFQGDRDYSKNDANNNNKPYRRNNYNNNKNNYYRNNANAPSDTGITQHVREERPVKRQSKLTKLLLLKRHSDIGFGFSIRGGVEHGTGIFVSNMNKYSDAYAQGLQVGDQILRANNASFDGILHDEAAQYIQRQKILRLIVLSLGVVPGSKIAMTEYQWMDCYGRPCSPLQVNSSDRRGSRGSRDGRNQVTSSRRLLAEDDERKVNVVVGNNSVLGLLLRGGCEYGLGIFVAGIDRDSVADRSGIMVGEQILEVNGIDFTQISHTDAAHIVRTSKMMTMILKDVGKIPLARIVYDKTEWLNKDAIAQRNSLQNRNSFKSKNPVFQQGITGGLLNHQSTGSPISFQWIDEKARSHLNKDEWATLKYYIKEYIHQNLSINEMGISLLELLDTKEKLSLVGEVRGIVRPQDIEMFDELMLRMEVEAMATNPNEETIQVDMSPTLSRDRHESNMRGKQRKRAGTKSSWRDDRNEYNYRHLSEDSYQSTFENQTEETMLAGSPQLSSSRNHRGQSLLDDTVPDGQNEILEPLSELVEEEFVEEEIQVEEVEELYATVNKQRRDEPPTSPLTEYTQSSPPVEMKTFQSPPFVKKEIDDTDFDNDKLGYAFSFLNSNETSPNLGRSEVEGDHDYDVIEEEHEASPPLQPNRLFRGFSGENFQTTANHVVGVDYNEVKIRKASQEGNNNGNDYRAPNLQDYQPTYEARHRGVTHRGSDGIKLMGEYDEINQHDDPTMNDNMNNSNGAAGGQFDLSKTMDKYYSDLPVNDIVRQSFLPTTRVNNTVMNSNKNSDKSVKSKNVNINNQQNQQQQIDYNNVLNESINDTTVNIGKIHTLNVQNQYQYERSLSPTQSYHPHLSLSTNETKTYGKPVMAKSPRPSYAGMASDSQHPPAPPPKPFQPTTTIFTRSHQEGEEPRRKTSTSEPPAVENKSILPEIHMFNKRRLKKTENGSTLLGYNLGEDEDEKDDPIYEEIEPRLNEGVGRPVIDIEKLNAQENNNNSPRILEQSNNEFSSPFSPRFKFSPRTGTSPRSRTSPRTSEYGDAELNIVTSSQQGQAMVENKRKFSIETERPKVQHNTSDLHKWLNKTDLRPAYKSSKKGIAFNREFAKPKSNALQAKIDVFSNRQLDSSGRAALQRQKIKEAKSAVEWQPRLVQIPNNKHDDDPGFEVDVLTNENEQNELVVSDITNIALQQLLVVGDVILRIEDHEFKGNVKKGLATRIIQAKFNSSNRNTVNILIK